MPPRATPQLEAVYTAVESGRDHPNAQQVWERVRRHLPAVSLSTVYRNLDKLARLGRLRVLRLDSGVGLYDAVGRTHDHFVCEQCSLVIDVELQSVPVESENRLRGHRVLRQSTLMYGVCGDCGADSGAGAIRS